MGKLSLLFTLLLLPLTQAFGQTGGQITGQVTDQSGAAVPNAAVTVTNTATNAARSTTSNSSGIYSFPDLTPGVYNVKAESTGFSVVVKANVELQVQQTERVDFVLAIGQSTQTIEV